MNLLKTYIRDVADFPKKGILFKDITPLLKSPDGVALCLESLLSQLQNLKIDKVVAIEARGFFFGILLAQALKVPFVPIRKAGKLPGKVVARPYDLEYSSDVLEMHDDAIQIGDNVLIHDDVLATGGTAEAVCRIVESAGGKVVQFNFIMELNELQGAKKISSYPIYAAINY